VATVGAGAQRDVQPVIDDHRCPKQAEPVNHHGREVEQGTVGASFARIWIMSTPAPTAASSRVQPPRPWPRAGALGGLDVASAGATADARSVMQWHPGRSSLPSPA